jgi:hypothetical protein
MNHPPSDTLSLTLPARGKSRARRRKPRKPTFWEAWFLAWMMIAVCFAVVDFLNSELVMAGWETSVAAIWWRSYHRARRGVLPYLGIMATAYIAGSGIGVTIIGAVR